METLRGIRRRNEFVVTPGLQERFERKVNIRSKDECWEWTGCTRSGYGCIKHEGKLLSAHCVAYSIANDGIPDGLIVCHSCDNRICCNPHHLHAGSFADNVHEARERGNVQQARGSKCPNARLSEQLVREIKAIRLIKGWGERRIGQLFNFSEYTIRDVIRDKNWAHVPWPTPDEAHRMLSKSNYTSVKHHHQNLGGWGAGP